MGDKATLAMARRELQGLYLGVLDDSVDLSFKDLASFQQHGAAERKPRIEPIREEPNFEKATSQVSKSPSLDFSKALHGAPPHRRAEEVYRERSVRNSLRRSGLRTLVDSNQVHDDASSFIAAGPVEGRRRPAITNSQVHDDVSVAGPFEERGGGRRRPGIPHSNICTLCSVYIYIFRHRCLVCGRVYCRQCVEVGMGEMSEGRKCIDCLGRRFSERYIREAGQTGCCCWGYPRSVKQQELMWAEKGPRKSGERRDGRSLVSRSQYGRSAVRSRSVTPVSGARSRSPVSKSYAGDEPVSFVSNSSFLPSVHEFPM